MTEPSGGSRRHRRSGGAQNPLQGLRRRFALVGALAIIVIAAAGLSIALSGGVPGSGSTPSSVSSPGVALGTSTPVVGASRSPGASSSLSASTSPLTSGYPGPSVAPASASPAGIRPSRIQITRLHIDLAIVDGDGIDAPIGKAAHYPGSGWPDGGTNIYIYAHARTGMFLSLWDAVVGDRIDLILADGSKRSYVVDKVLPKVPPDAVEYLQPTPVEQLTLQTSTGPDETYPRFVVIAHPTP
jgi:Sortase domain